MNLLKSFNRSRHGSCGPRRPDARRRMLCAGRPVLLAVSLCAPVLAFGQPLGTVYRCPGNTYSNALTAEEAKRQGCTEVQGGNLTVIEGTRPQPAAAPATSRPAPVRVPEVVQRERDADARRILERELQQEQERLAELQKEFNQGEPERQGNERNYQRYLDRVEQLRNDIARKQADVTAIRRELDKLPPAQ